MSSRLKRARLRAGFGQIKLAKRLGTDQSTVSRIENGQIPRESLMLKAVRFVRDVEAKKTDRQTKIYESVAKSKEMKALIARIAAEL